MERLDNGGHRALELLRFGAVEFDGLSKRFMAFGGAVKRMLDIGLLL